MYRTTSALLANIRRPSATGSSDEIEPIEPHTAAYRLIMLLDELETDSEGGHEIRLKVRKHVIASRLTIRAQETFSRTLKKLVTSGYIKVHESRSTVLDL